MTEEERDREKIKTGEEKVEEKSLKGKEER